MKKARQLIALVLIAGLSLVTLTACGGDASKKNAADAQKAGNGTYQVGIIQLVDHVALDKARQGFEAGLAASGLTVGKDVVIDFKNAQNDQSNLSTIAQQFASDKKDLVCAIATQSAVSMASASKDIPIVGTAITDYEGVKLVKSNEAPGGNVTGTSDLNPVVEQLDLMCEILPELKKVGIIYTSSEENSRIQANLFKKAAEAKGIEVVEATVTNVNDIQQAATNLTKDVEAIYVPTDNSLASAINNLTSITTPAKIPVFPGESALIEGGALATLSVDYYELGKQAGEMAARILKGEAKVGEIPVETSREYKVAVNQEVAKELGIEIPESVLSKIAK